MIANTHILALNYLVPLTFFLYTELPEDLTKLAMLEKSLTIKRVGDSIEEISVMADKEYKAVLKLDETFDWTSDDNAFSFKV